MENNPINKIKECIDNLENNNFNIYFFTIDTKGVPSGYLSYIYDTAKTLKKLGYKVHMLHQEAEFVGVESWLGEEYSTIPHHNIEKDKIDITPSDFIFIPEFYSNVMSQTAKLPCKRIVIAQNFNYLTQVIPAGASWDGYGIKDCIVTTDFIEHEIKNCFPNVTTYKVEPCVNENIFNNNTDAPKKLIFNIVSKEKTDINQIVKPFFWKYPMYSWVSFRDLRGLPKETFAEYLKDGAFTIWLDDVTYFGYSAIEAMKCGSIVIGKVPENEPEWLVKNGEIQNNGVWFFNNSDVHKILAGAIESFITDNIPSNIYDEMENMRDKYTTTEFEKNITEVYINKIFNDRKTELEATLTILENNK